MIKEELDAFKARDLAGVELDYLFLDAAVFKLRPGAPAEPVLCAGASPPAAARCCSGWPQPVKGHDPWAGFLGRAGRAGPRTPLLVVTDGAPGLISAMALTFPR